MVSVNPFRLSVQVISISCTLRAFKSVRTLIQKEELNLHVKDFFQTVLFQSDTKVNGLVYDFAVIPYLENDTVHPDNEINRIKRTVLLLQGSLIDFVGNLFQASSPAPGHATVSETCLHRLLS